MLDRLFKKAAPIDGPYRNVLFGDNYGKDMTWLPTVDSAYNKWVHKANKFVRHVR